MIRQLKDKWVGVSETGLFEAVADCMTLGAGLKTSEFVIDDVIIKPNPEFIASHDADQMYIHTMTISQKTGNGKKRRRLLLVPGYGASAVSYFPVFQKLREEFEITCIDVLGFGCSGRPDFNLVTVDQVMAFIKWQFQAWMDATGYDDEAKGQYSLFCHSLGCYFASYWAIDNYSKID